MSLTHWKQVQTLSLTRRDPSPNQQSMPWTGINIAGLEFGMNTEGTLTAPIGIPPMEQIKHFASQNVNTFRIPFAWQRLQPTLNGPLDEQAFGALKQYVDQVTAVNARAIIDLHNYGRRDGKIVGESQDLPADSLVNVWQQLAQRFAGNPKVAFGIMNEPHDMQPGSWVKTLQAVVTAIRKTGANNMLIIPGDEWCKLNNFAESYHAGLSQVKNPDGSTTGLIFEIHQYFDQDASGKDSTCINSHADELKAIVDLLKKDNRQAMVTEFGGGSDPSCPPVLADFVKTATGAFPTIIGYQMWSAGAFPQDYPLVITVLQGNTWVDQQNFKAIQKLLPANGGGRGTP